ncbi:MAG: adenylosuccinate lyase, partial [Methylocystis sp.]
AMKVWKTAFEGGGLSEREGDFRALLGADAEVSAKLTSAELDALFDLSYHFKHVDDIFERVFAS